MKVVGTSERGEGGRDEVGERLTKLVRASEEDSEVHGGGRLVAGSDENRTICASH